MSAAGPAVMATAPGRTALLLHVTGHGPHNLTVPEVAGWTGVGGEGGAGEPTAPLCTLCGCGVLNRALVVIFMAALAFAIVAGNVGSAPSPQWGGVLGPWQPCMLVGPVFAGCTFVSISTIFLMTAERCLAILRPLHKDSLVTRRRTLLFITLSWAGSFLLALAPLLFSGGFTLEYNGCSRMCNYAPLGVEPGDLLLLFPAFDFTLLGATLAVNVVSFTSIHSYTRRRRLLLWGSGGGGVGAEGGRGGACHHRPSFSDIKAAKTISVLTLAFAGSFTPIAVLVLGNVVGHAWCSFSFLAFWVLTANSCCNVVIYGVRDWRFRRGLALLFRRDTSQRRPPRHGEKA
ncbi:hypothetical protein NHX12_006439 [Muraenolepis orangiensis]|uniref:G-protein coupled receptors family 1 profile domain-containing protein n=1 Tax=Muraenolepis orangiensis TaxID=630683 RepID=A0A9Q0DX12_9TELE|nr:hypothetical protein NHX12_006439 [Muraenolepis orangiensis]